MRISYNKNDLGKSFGFAVAVMMFIQVLLSAIFSPFVDSDTKQFVDWAYWVVQALYTLIIGATPFVYAKMTKTNLLSATKMNQKPQWAHILWGFGATVCLVCLMIPVNSWFMDLIELIGLKRPSVDMPKQIVPMIFIACILPAFTEEILFRGTVSQCVVGNKNKAASIALCGALFALYHINPAQTVHQFVFGCFLTLLVFRSGSVWTSVCVHFFNNVLVVVLTFVIPNEQSLVSHWGWLMALLGALSFAACVFGYFKTTKSNWQTDEEEVPQDKTSLVMLLVAVAGCAALWVLSLFAL